MVERKTLNLVVVGSIPTGGAFSHVRAFLAEWSKALDLSSSIGFDAEVRTLQEALTFLPSRLGARALRRSLRLRRQALWGISSIGRVRR